MNFDSWPSQGRIYIFAVRPRAAHWEGGVGATAVYIYTEYIEWRWRRGRSHSRSQHEIRLFSSGLQTDFGFLRDPPLAQSKESSPLTHHGGRGPKKKANFWLKKKVEEKKEGGFILIFHPSPHLAALRFPFHHSTFLRDPLDLGSSLLLLFLLLLSLNTSTCDEIQFYSADCVSL